MAEPVTAPLFELDLGGGAPPIRPNSADELTAFITNEWDMWSWLFEGQDVGQGGTDTPATVRGQLKTLRGVINQYSANGANLDAVRAAIVSAYTPASGSPKLLHSSSIDAEYIFLLRDTLTPLHALGAYAAITGRAFTSGSPPVQYGGVSAIVRSMGITPETPREAFAALSDARKVLSDAQREARDRADALHNEAVGLLKRYETQGKALFRWARIKRGEFVKAGTAKIETAVVDLKAVETAYREQMALRAPVEYWQTKASQHEVKSKSLLWWVVGYGVFATVVLLAGLSVLAYVALGAAEPIVHEGQLYTKPASVFIILATIGIAASTVAFWAGRILIRLYLSELHLGMDARERETMVMTYLALIAERAAEGLEDRHIVLTSLFRPTADGLVKEDAAPEASVAALAARALDQGMRRG